MEQWLGTIQDSDMTELLASVAKLRVRPGVPVRCSQRAESAISGELTVTVISSPLSYLCGAGASSPAADARGPWTICLPCLGSASALLSLLEPHSLQVDSHIAACFTGCQEAGK